MLKLTLRVGRLYTLFWWGCELSSPGTGGAELDGSLRKYSLNSSIGV